MRKMAVLLALLFMASCAQVPKEKSYPISYQEKMQASEHWRVLAEDISNKVKSATFPGDKIFIYDGDQSTFGNAMRTFLTTELQNKGMVPSSDPKSTYAIIWQVQEVYHKADRRSVSGLIVGLIDVLQAIFLGRSDEFIKPHTEIIISYDLYKGQALPSITRGTQIYYVNDVDADHYRSEAVVASQTSLRPITYDITNR